MDFQTLDYRLDDGIATITLQRPSVLNAVNAQMSRELPLAWARFESDPAARVAILTGSGERALSVGADLADLPVAEPGGLAGFRWSALQNAVTKPVICAVNGMAVGGGLHFVADSDIVLAAEHASFFDTHVKVGLVAGLEPVMLARRIPLEAVMRLALSGGAERLDAARALALGLVGEVLPPARLMTRAREIASAIARHSPAALARTRKAIWGAKELPLHEALQQAWDLIMAQAAHPDAAEGARAFLEKRPPRWRAPGDG